MLSRCTLGVVPARYWIGRRGPVLPKYSYNVIRKCNTKIDLMCLIADGFDFKAFCLKVVDSGFYLENIGFYGNFRGARVFVGKVRFK